MSKKTYNSKQHSLQSTLAHATRYFLQLALTLVTFPISKTTSLQAAMG